MTALRYRRHSVALAFAAILFWYAKDLRLPIWIANFNFLQFFIMGALHATSIVVSLRIRTSTRDALVFIALAGALSSATPDLSIIGTLPMLLMDDFLVGKNLGIMTLFVSGSAIGAAGYWLLVRQFWIQSFRRADLIRTVALCATATLSVGLLLNNIDGYERGVPRISNELTSPLFTFAWWIAFSISLYWNEKSNLARSVGP